MHGFINQPLPGKHAKIAQFNFVARRQLRAAHHAERAGLLVFVVAVQRGIGFSLRRAGIRSATVNLQGIGAGRRTARRGFFLAVMSVDNQFFLLAILMLHGGVL